MALQKALAKQGRKAVFTLRKYISKFVNINPLVVCDLFDKFVLPVISYGAEVWEFHPGEAVEKIHRQFMRSI